MNLISLYIINEYYIYIFIYIYIYIYSYTTITTSLKISDNEFLEINDLTIKYCLLYIHLFIQYILNQNT